MTPTAPLDGVAELTAATPCSTISTAIGEPLSPAAPQRHLPLLLVEDPGAWTRDAVGDSARVPDGMWPQAWEDHGVRIQLIRRPGRRRAAGRRAFLVATDPAHRFIEAFEDATPRLIADIDLARFAAGQPDGRGTLTDAPLLLACTHGKVDACCARLGRPIAAAIAEVYPGLTWETTHVGGCRFAANLVTLPDQSYYGRLTPAAAVDVARATVERGEAPLTHLRGTAGADPFVQHATLLARAADDVLRAGDVTVEDPGETGDGHARTVRLRTPVATHRITLVRADLATTPYGCRKDGTHTWTRFEVRGHRRSPLADARSA